MSASLLQQAVLSSLRQHPDVKAVFGDPARLIDDESEAPAYPYARLESHSVRDVSASQCVAREHLLSFGVAVRQGGFKATDAALQSLYDAAHTLAPDILGQSIILIQTVQCDAVRTAGAAPFRGTLRLRILAEETLP